MQGLERTTIYRWSARYEAEGAAGFLPYQKNRVYPPELKLKAVLEYLSGAGSLEEISKKTVSCEMIVNSATG